MSYSLFRHQAEAEPLLLGGSAMLWWEMRLGKTRAVLHSFSRLYEQGGPRLLVIVTEQIAKEVWLKEAQEMGLGIPVLLGFGTTGRTIRVQPDDPIPASVPRVLVINWALADAWLPLIQHALQLRTTDLALAGLNLAGDPRLVLCTDEGHEHLTNPKSKTYVALRDLSLMAERVWELSGTMYVNDGLDLYHQLRLLGPKANPWQLWQTERFGSEFCVAVPNPWRGRVVRDPKTKEPKTYKNGKIVREGGYDFKGLAEGAEYRLLERCPAISKLMEEDVRDVPLPYRIPHWVDAGDGLLNWRDGQLDAAIQQLAQRKIGLTLDFLGALPRPIVVFGWNVSYTTGLYDALLKKGARVALITGEEARLGSDTSTRGTIQDAFRDGYVDVLVGNMKSIGKAIDLSRAHHAVYGQPYYDAALMYQCEARMRGPRQTSDHIVHHYLLVADSVDEHVWVNKLRKGEEIERFNRAGREVGREMAS